MFSFLLSAMRNSSAFAAAKRSTLVTQFITTELGNAALAASWTNVVSKLPLTVPDTYAAAASEEAAFTKVRPPKISHKRVVIATSQNLNGWFVTFYLIFQTQPGPEVVVNLPAKSALGAVTGDGGSITCGLENDICSNYYPAGTTITLTETEQTSVGLPGTGTFEGWTGCTSVSSDGKTCTVTIPSKASSTYITTITPTFVQLQLLAVGRPFGISPTGSGTVTSNPAGIDCTFAATVTSGTCSLNFNLNGASTVTLTAAPASGSSLFSWEGCATSSGNTCTVNLTAGITGIGNVQAYFVLSASSYSVTAVPISGAGTVTSSPSGINCINSSGDVTSGTCTDSFPTGTMVVLTATPTSPATTSSWMYCDSTVTNMDGSSTCTITSLTANRLPYVTFSP
jgi:hypothetical protein